MHLYNYNGTRYEYDTFLSAGGTSTTDIEIDDNSGFLIHSILGHGVNVYKYGGSSYAFLYKITSACVNDLARADLFEDKVVIGCDDGNVFISTLGSSSYSAFASYSDSSNSIAAIDITATYLAVVDSAGNVNTYIWNGATY